MYTLIVGGNGLFGSAISRFLADNNYKVIISDIRENKTNIPFFKLNTTNEKSFIKLFQDLKKNKIRIKNIINCSYPKPIEFNKHPLNISKKQFLEYFEMHLWSYNLTIRSFSQYFKKNKIKGHIINFSSIYGSSLPDFKIYDDYKLFTSFEYFFSKHNITHITKYYAKFLKDSGIRLNTISPGGVNDEFKKKFVKKYSSKTITKSMLNSNDLNGLIKFLISDEANKITAQNFIVDDGFTL